MPRTADLVIVSNRLPVHRVGRGASARWEISPGGLVSALTPILKERRGGVWVGWSGIAGSAPEPFELDEIHNVPVGLSRSEVEDYYHGFSNRTLWPLYHDAVRTPQYHRHWWRPYLSVNRRFAEAAARNAAKGALVWVHDYHLQLVPAMLRKRRPDLRIGFFLHIPFPPQELFAQIPWRRPILEGMLGADVLGFQTKNGARNFCELANRYTDAERRGRALTVDGRDVEVSEFPVSIDYALHAELAARESVQRRAEALRRQLGHPTKILVGVDRLDYTKGIDTRLRAWQEVLASGRASPDETVFVQLAVPSREEVEEYVELRSRVEQLVGRINGEHASLGASAVHYLHRSVSLEELVALYVAGDVMVVTPLRDGMNLVAKEFVACRLDGDGVLILSEFTGSSIELKNATVVNPHDIDALADTMHEALQMPIDEQRRRMRSLQRVVRRNDVFRWANRFMEALGS
ncbi:MAG TPA: trehalose-6-phosphate synthase [Thermoanaerobaculia bacterium]|nr:trehalose-6-phosphate synthase [Thermoanaerobaculia bacterium]